MAPRLPPSTAGRNSVFSEMRHLSRRARRLSKDKGNEIHQKQIAQQ